MEEAKFDDSGEEEVSARQHCRSKQPMGVLRFYDEDRAKAQIVEAAGDRAEINQDTAAFVDTT